MRRRQFSTSSLTDEISVRGIVDEVVNFPSSCFGLKGKVLFCRFSAFQSDPIQSDPIQSIPIVIVTRLKLVWNGLRGRCKFRPKKGFFFLLQSFLLSHVLPYRWRGKDFFHPERNIRERETHGLTHDASSPSGFIVELPLWLGRRVVAVAQWQWYSGNSTDGTQTPISFQATKPLTIC